MRLWDHVRSLWSGARTVWRLVYDDSVMECRLERASGGGVEIRYVYRGELYHSFVHASRAAAEDEARTKRDELLRAGWRTQGASTPETMS